MARVIEVEGVAKAYRLGVIGRGTIQDDLSRAWARFRGLPDPMLKLGQADHGNQVGQTVWALRDVSFNVDEGDVLGVIGRNGAGKSTILKLLSQVTAPTRGEIRVRGRIASLLEVGTGFHPELTGRENVYLNGAILGMTQAEVARKFDDIVEFAEVAEYIDTPVKRYSSGMYVRLAFAVAAHLEPEILVVDEVLAVGDAQFQRKCLRRMSSIAREGRTVLFVSHNMASVQSLCTRAIVLTSGRLDFGPGPTSQAIDSYLRHLQELSAVDPGARTDRKGQGDIRVEGFGCYDRDGRRVDRLTCGAWTEFRLDYRVRPGITLEHIGVGFPIRAAGGPFVTMLSNVLVGDDLGPLSGSGHVSCILERLPFAPGAYVLNTAVYASSVMQDWIQEAFTVQVTEGDFYGVGAPAEGVPGEALFPCTWRINGDPCRADVDT
ncbi:MAG: ABC transporter ATP-binding protein [Armatimonadetes bacterium]|nr:ABC transporter ATP-binding protein [Armatimonadota bacterium]